MIKFNTVNLVENMLNLVRNLNHIWLCSRLSPYLSHTSMCIMNVKPNISHMVSLTWLSWFQKPPLC